MKQKFINIIFSWQIIEKKIDFLEIRPFRKLAKTFSYKRYQFDFLHKFSIYKSPIFQIEIKSFKTFFFSGIFQKSDSENYNFIHLTKLFFIKDINLIFYTNFHDIKAQYFK